MHTPAFPPLLTLTAPLSPPLSPSPPSLSLHPSLQLSHYGGSPVRRTESLTHSHCLASRL